MKPEYVATKSAWAAVTPLRVLFFWLIIPLIVMIVSIAVTKCERIEFYQDRIVVKSGLINRRERTQVFTGVIAVSVYQSLWGRICNYGDLIVDVAGRWDIGTEHICNPNGLKEYLEGRTIRQGQFQHIVTE